MRKTRIWALLLALCCCMTGTSIRAAEPVSVGRVSLYDKTLWVLGDSYTAGFGLSDGSHGFMDLVSEALGLEQSNYSISGSSFAAGPRGSAPMVDRCMELPKGPAPDIILLQGGSNDHVRDIPLGQTDERNEESFCGALNLIMDHLQESYPEARIVCFTPWISDGGQNGLSLTAEDYVQAMVQLCEARHILCYDASQAEENGIAMNDESFRARFCLSSADRYHLNPAGHRRFAPVLADWLCRTLTSGETADRFADLQIAGEPLRQAAGLCVSTGLMSAEGELFTPTRSASRQLMAQALYTLAGQPLSTAHSIPDVSPEAAYYPAVCYVIDAGLMWGPEGFFPELPLTRETLVTVLHQYYTAIYGGEVTKLTGLGPYSDGAEVSDASRTPMGWALAAGLISDKDGALHPQGAVSRGELAVALGTFLKLLGEIP